MTATAPTLRNAFAGRRGRLLAGLLLAEFAGAVQSIAYSSVLPLAARELHGSSLYGATLAAGLLATILTLASGITVHRPRRALLVATALYLIGVALAATAPWMSSILIGSVLRGIAGGLLAGFGLSAIGGLYDDALRRRVLGLFAVVWLLPSLAGPAVNAVVAAACGWRWAMAWPAAVVVLARGLIGRDADLVPWTPSGRRVDLRNGVVLVIGLIVASIASTLGTWWAPVLFVIGVATAIGATVRALTELLGAVAAARRPGLITFAALTLAFFGGHGLIALAVVDGLGRGVVAGSIALGAGLVAWSLTGLRPPRAGGASDSRRDVTTLGLALVAVALAAVAAAQYAPLSAALGLTIIAWTVAGFGMGLAYPRLSAAPFDRLAAPQVTAVATAVAFAELAGTAVGSLLGGGVYSLGIASGEQVSVAIAVAFAVLAAIATLSACSRQFGGASRLRRSGTSSVTSG